MKLKYTIILLLAVFIGFAQEEEKPKEYDVNARKGQFFASWGWNRSSYSTSDITFKGNDFDFTIHDMKADDRANSFGLKFFHPEKLTLPQTNLEIGYFFKDNYNIVIGYDHMKYVMRNGHNARVTGEINTGEFGYGEEEILYNFDGVYDQIMDISNQMVTFEHTDGLNYIFVGVNRFDNLNKLLGINTSNFEVNVEEGIDVGFVMPKTNTAILGNKRYDQFHVSGYGMSASAGLQLTFFKRFFIKTDFKVGYINMGDIRITEDSSEKAEQHFTFAETAYTFGYRFRLF